jgi:hypothetical protein
MATDPYRLGDAMVETVAELAAVHGKRLVVTFDDTTGLPIYRIVDDDGLTENDEPAR